MNGTTLLELVLVKRRNFDGGEASLKWIEMLEVEDAVQRQEITSDLKSYCYLDTLAMVKLLEHVQSVNKKGVEPPFLAQNSA